MPKPPAFAVSALGRYRPPRLGRVFLRERLFAVLDAQQASCGLWIAGPPGMGKTTLTATYLQARGVRCLWLQLDAADADAASFAGALLAAGAAAHARSPKVAPPGADDLRDVPGFIRRTLRQLSASLTGPWALVLDNLQEIGAAPAIHAGLAASLADLPEGCSVVFLSREPPPDAYARALSAQQLALVDEPQLRFDVDDTRQLLALHGRDWPAAQLQQLTDGWAAAMILMLATRAELGAEGAARDGAARSRLFSLFAGEVLAAMTAADVAVLLRVAFLPSASAAMANALSGNPGAGELLADLARRSLFTERREGTPPVYTFHALFSDFLQARAAEVLDPDALQLVQQDAARLLAEHGQADAAIVLLLRARAWDAAVALIVAEAGGLNAQGRTAILHEWIVALPQALRDEPWPAYWLGVCLLEVDPGRALVHLEHARRGHAAREDGHGAFCTAATAADAIVSMGANLHALQDWMPVLEQHAPRYLAHPDPLTDLRVLPGLLAAFVHRLTAHPLTATLADAAEQLLDQPLGPGQRILLGTLAYYLLWTGQTVRLDRILLKVDRLSAGPDIAPGTLLRWYGVSVLIRSLLGRIDDALRDAKSALALTETAAPAQRAKAHLMMGLAAVSGRDAAAAHHHLAEAARRFDANSTIDATTHDFQLGILRLLEADWTGAEALMRAAVRSGQASGWPLREHIAMLGCALAATQVDDLAGAEAALSGVLAHSFHAVCRWHHWLAGLIEANLALRGGESARALRALREAFAVGRSFGFDFGPMPFSCGDMMSRLAALALANDIEPAFTLQLIRRHALPAPPGADEHWPWPLRVRLLGGFELLREQAPAAARKESRKPLELLKILIALGGGPVPVDRLAAALWPDAAGDAARNSFDNTLHRLRKLLGGDHHLVLQAGGLSLDAASCWTDVAALERTLTELDVCADVGGLPALAARALALYRGPLLAGVEDLPDVLAARDRLAARFARLLALAGRRLEAAGHAADAVPLYERVLEQQPLAEEVCRHLIACQLRLGRRAEAFEAYRRCRQQLMVLLNLHPSPETEALIAPLSAPQHDAQLRDL